MAEKKFKAGDVIFKQGVFENSMFEIAEGTVGIYVNYGEERERKLTELGAGRIFGEMGLIECYPRSATAVALSDVTAQEITAAELSAYFEEKPERIMQIMRGQATRLRELTQDYEEVCRTLGSWDKEKENTGLLAKLRKFAELYEQSFMSGNMRYNMYTHMSSYNRS